MYTLPISFCVNIFYFNPFSQLIELFNLQIVVSGTNSPRIGGEKHDIKCIRKHPQYTGEKEGGWKDDIAVITVSLPNSHKTCVEKTYLISRLCVCVCVFSVILYYNFANIFLHS